MSDTLSQASLKVLRNSRIPNDSSTSSTNAITDIKQYINQRARSVWSRRLFREYIILGTYAVPASTKTVALSDISITSGFDTDGRARNAGFYEIGAMREGDNPLLPEDIGAVNNVDAGAWSANTAPVYFINRGQSGIYLLGQYTAETTLSFWGKAGFQDLTNDETWILGDSDALIEGATADMYANWWKDQNQAAKYEQKFEDAIRLLVDAQETQAAAKRRITPGLSMGNHRAIDFTSKSGIIR
jgi:hypothetical protein